MDNTFPLATDSSPSTSLLVMQPDFQIIKDSFWQIATRSSRQQPRASFLMRYMAVIPSAIAEPWDWTL